MALLLSILKHLQHQPNSTFYFSILCFITILCVLKLTRINKSNLPPSPPKLPFLGNLHQIRTLPHRSLRALSNKYGPLMLLQLGQTLTLVVSSTDVVEEIAKTHDVAFSNRAHTKAAKMFFYECMDLGYAPYGEEWRQKRKISVVELLSTNRARSFRPIKENEVAVLVDTIHVACQSKGSYVNLSKILIATASNMASRCILGRSFETHDGIGELVRKMLTQLIAFSVGDFFPSLGWVDVLTGLMSQLKVTFVAIDAFLEEVIEEHKSRNRNRNNDHSNNKDFVDIPLQLQEKDMPEFELTRDSLKAILLDMFVGGSDTTSTALEWAFAELIKNSQSMKKVQEEVRKVVGEKSKIEENDVNQMNYLKCVIKETLRLHPPVPLLVPRETASSVKINGYDIPPKTTVYVNVWAIQRDPKLWDNAEQSIPERFAGSQVDFKGQDFHLIPFGIGRRGCPGISFGIAFVEYVLANLLYWFDWKLPNSGVPMEGIDMSEMSGHTVTKKVPLHLEPIPYSFDSKA